MNTYIVTGDLGTLEERLAGKEVELIYRARHVEMAALRTELALEELQELLPDYRITHEKTYEVDEKCLKEPNQT